MEDVEDYYTYYVEVLKISEDLFWYGDISFVKAVAENVSAYRQWISCMQEEMLNG